MGNSPGSIIVYEIETRINSIWNIGKSKQATGKKKMKDGEKKMKDEKKNHPPKLLIKKQSSIKYAKCLEGEP